MKKYNLKTIMTKAWKIFRKAEIIFTELLHKAWLSAKAVEINQNRIERAKASAEVIGETTTWSEWKKLGYMVSHRVKALFNVKLI